MAFTSSDIRHASRRARTSPSRHRSSSWPAAAKAPPGAASVGDLGRLERSSHRRAQGEADLDAEARAARAPIERRTDRHSTGGTLAIAAFRALWATDAGCRQRRRAARPRRRGCRRRRRREKSRRQRATSLCSPLAVDPSSVALTAAARHGSSSPPDGSGRHCIISHAHDAPSTTSLSPLSPPPSSSPRLAPRRGCRAPGPKFTGSSALCTAPGAAHPAEQLTARGHAPAAMRLRRHAEVKPPPRRRRAGQRRAERRLTSAHLARRGSATRH